MGRRPPAEDGASAAREHRREVARLHARRPVPDPIDAAVLAQESSNGESVLELGDRESRVEQLAARHDAVLPSRDARQFPLHRPVLGSHHHP